MPRGNVNHIDLRIGEFYLWDEEDATDTAYEIYHTDCDDSLFKRRMTENEARKWVKDANQILKESKEPVYNITGLLD